MGSDHLSVEVNSDSFQFLSEDYNSSYDTDMLDLFGSNLLLSENNIDGFCDSANLVGKKRWISIKRYFYISIESIGNSMEPNEFEEYFGLKALSNPTYDINRDLVVSNSLPIYGIINR